MDPSDTPSQDALESELKLARRTISTDSYPVSIGELTNMYRDGELIIRPAFQRLFRWDMTQKSRLIESILLGIPVPSIFVAQDDAGRWELVDGLQRVSTLLQMQGLLDHEGYPPLELTSTKYLPSMEGKTWKDGKGNSLTDAQRLDIKRSKLDVKIIRRESSISTKFDLFQRLNSFGSPLSAQEIRNATLVGVNPDFVEWLQVLASQESFVASTRLADRDIESKYDEELVLRFLWLHQLETPSRKVLTNFQDGLETASLDMAENHSADAARLEATFNTTFDLLAAADENVFRKWVAAKGRFQGGFLNTAYEVLGIGLGYLVSEGLPYRSDLSVAAKELWGQADMQSNFATGKSTEDRLVIMLPKGRLLLAG